jgi:hypothetical protein
VRQSQDSGRRASVTLPSVVMLRYTRGWQATGTAPQRLDDSSAL